MSLRIAGHECADVLRVLADDTRLEVVRLLLDGARHVGGLNAVLRIDQSLLSHHLGVMRRAGLVVSVRDGKAVLYQLAPGLDARRRGRARAVGDRLTRAHQPAVRHQPSRPGRLRGRPVRGPAAGVAASAIPARRATRIEPARVLQAD